MTDSATFTTPEAGDEDLGDQLLEVLPPDGSTIGNLSARVLDLTKELVTEFQEATQIIGFFDKWDEVTRIKRQIKRSILDQPFGDKALVDAVTERFMDLGKRHFR